MSLRPRQQSLSQELQQQGPQDVLDEEPPGRTALSEERRDFDRNLAIRHTYLGDVDDLERYGATLEPGHQCCLPLLSLPGTVLSPGTTLPLRLTTRQSSHTARMAISAPHQYSCLLVVACWNLLTNSQGFLACTTELRQVKEFEDGSINCLAVGRQRCRICNLKSRCKADIIVLDEDALQSMPKEVREGSAAWSSWACRAFDPRWLARQAGQAYSEIAPQIKQPEGSPSSLSYWLSSNIPLHFQTRQELLAMDNTAARLRRLIELLRAMRRSVICRRCSAEVAHAKDLLAMSEAGAGSVFVNAHGYVHDLLTIKRVQSVVLEGNPEAEHSWFPGYHWTVARCRNCDLHLGWKFTAVEKGLQPPSFWGLRFLSVRQQPVSEASLGVGWDDSNEDFWSPWEGVALP